MWRTVHASLSIPRSWIRAWCRQAHGWLAGATQDVPTLLHGVADAATTYEVQGHLALGAAT